MYILLFIMIIIVIQVFFCNVGKVGKFHMLLRPVAMGEWGWLAPIMYLKNIFFGSGRQMILCGRRMIHMSHLRQVTRTSPPSQDRTINTHSE